MTIAIKALALSLFGVNLALGPIGIAFLILGAVMVAGLIIWDRYREGVKRVVDILIKFLQLLNPITAGLALLETFTGIDVPLIRGFAHGGTATTSGPAIVGERGPELVSLPAGAQVSPISRSTTFNIDATYTNPQDPATIRLDLEALNMMTGA